MNNVHPSCKKNVIIIALLRSPYIIYSLPFHVLAPFQTPLGRGLYRSFSRGGLFLTQKGLIPPENHLGFCFSSAEVLSPHSSHSRPLFKPPCTLVTTHLRRIRLLDVEDVQVFWVYPLECMYRENKDQTIMCGLKYSNISGIGFDKFEPVLNTVQQRIGDSGFVHENVNSTVVCNDR